MFHFLFSDITLVKWESRLKSVSLFSLNKVKTTIEKDDEIQSVFWIYLLKYGYNRKISVIFATVQDVYHISTLFSLGLDKHAPMLLGEKVWISRFQILYSDFTYLEDVQRQQFWLKQLRILFLKEYSSDRFQILYIDSIDTDDVQRRSFNWKKEIIEIIEL